MIQRFRSRTFRAIGLLSLCLMGNAMWAQGTVSAWGFNLYGQLGNGTATNSTAPVQVTGLTGVMAVAGGGYHSLAVKNGPWRIRDLRLGPSFFPRSRA